MYTTRQDDVKYSKIIYYRLKNKALKKDCSTRHMKCRQYYGDSFVEQTRKNVTQRKKRRYKCWTTKKQISRENYLRGSFLESWKINRYQIFVYPEGRLFEPPKIYLNIINTFPRHFFIFFFKIYPVWKLNTKIISFPKPFTKLYQLAVLSVILKLTKSYPRLRVMCRVYFIFFRF